MRAGVVEALYPWAICDISARRLSWGICSGTLMPVDTSVNSPALMLLTFPVPAILALYL